jgi:hypothetical protein
MVMRMMMWMVMEDLFIVVVWLVGVDLRMGLNIYGSIVSVGIL